MSDWGIAAVIVLPITYILVLIQISTLAGRISLQGMFRGSTLLYFLIACIGNLFATSLAAATTINQIPSILPGWAWYAFLGIFGFEAILKNVNLTFSGIGFLSINEWITKAKEAAAADVIEVDVLTKEKEAKSLAGRLKLLTTQDLNAHVIDILGNGQVQVLEFQATQSGADPQLVKALALAKGNYKSALAISPK